ncbi:MAG TPA: DUF2431 domain-containing protein, partial [Alphaproteobacteria bacterium]|nr:DUF2431 domain-containing protein [Alphaproteobacteria bacterium]
MQFTINHLLPIRIWENLGDVLLLGEGNLSFANSLLRQSAFEITNLIATTFDGKRRLTEEARKNAD